MGNTPLGVLCSANFFGIIQSSGSTVSLNLFPSARRIGSIRKASQRPPPPSLPRSPTSLLLLPLSLLSRDGGLLFSGSSAESASDGTLDAPCFSRWRKPTPSPVASIALASCTLSCFGGPVGGACRMPARFRLSRKLAFSGWGAPSRSLSLCESSASRVGFVALLVFGVAENSVSWVGAAWRSILSQRVRRSFRKGLA